ncbi:hypothetical protein HY02_08560 [Peptococcaceae bacterium SCADC1_2_3]|nr:hypothetical protein DK28_0214995 [Peptococcaceae bacterium SCADC1_2_3]KFI37284.1 hypothetical protein HY02_08560 [Peptococcaceae bacterium SCADC1_2_3]
MPDNLSNVFCFVVSGDGGNYFLLRLPTRESQVSPWRKIFFQSNKTPFFMENCYFLRFFMTFLLLLLSGYAGFASLPFDRFAFFRTLFNFF